MLSEQEVSAAVGTTAYGADGHKLGMVEAFFVDDRTGAPTWVAVTTGLFGTRHSIVPAGEATFSDGTLRLPVTKESVTSAPHMAGDHLDPAEEDALRRHYGVGVDPDSGVDTGLDGTRPVPVRPADEVPVETAQPAAEPTVALPTASDGGMTRSEERLRVGTEQVATTRARLVKYVVTEEVQITVPIRREEIRVEQVPVDAVDGPDDESLVSTDRTGTTGSAGLPGEIVLHTERPVVTVEVVPVERVRLRVDVVEGQETVSGQVQREQIVVDQDRVPGVSPR